MEHRCAAHTIRTDNPASEPIDHYEPADLPPISIDRAELGLRTGCGGYGVVITAEISAAIDGGFRRGTAEVPDFSSPFIEFGGGVLWASPDVSSTAESTRLSRCPGLTTPEITVFLFPGLRRIVS